MVLGVIKLSEFRHRRKYSGPWAKWRVLRPETKNTVHKRNKINKLDFIKIKNFHFMETTLCLGNKNRSYWLGENNCKPVSEIGLVSRIYKELQNFGSKDNLIRSWSKEMNRHFTKEDLWIANKYGKMSTRLAITEMKIKTLLDITTSLLEQPKLKIVTVTKWWGCGQMISHTLEYKMIQPFWKIVWPFLKQLTIYLLYSPAVALMDIYSRETKMYVHKEHYKQMFITALFLISKN